MDLQPHVLLKAIAISAGLIPATNNTVRSEAYELLQNFKVYASTDHNSARMCLQMIQSPQLVLEETHGLLNVTVSAKLFSMTVLQKYVQLQYGKLDRKDAAMLRSNVVETARMTANSVGGNSNMKESECKLIASKLSDMLSDLAARDFPQRWMEFWTDLLSIWTAEEDVGIGTKICLDCLIILIENCTDSDYNSKIDTKRRNDVLQGLNEVSGQMLPRVYSLLSTQYSQLAASKSMIGQMEAFLRQEARPPTPEEQQQYNKVIQTRDSAAKQMEPALTFLSTVCAFMPVEWMFVQNADYDFTSVFLHLLGESTNNINVLAVTCLDKLAHRKLEESQWFRLISCLPNAVSVANETAISSHQNDLSPNRHIVDFLLFHKSLSKFLASLLQNHISFVTTDKDVLQNCGQKYDALCHYFALLNGLLSHPSGAVCSQQINLWTALLRDPQLPQSNILSQFLGGVLESFMKHVVKLRWADVEENIHPFADVLEKSWDDDEEYELWFAELRSKSTGLFRSIAHSEPEISTSYLCQKLEYLLDTHGNGEPRDHLDSSNNLTMKSDAVIQFDGVTVPLEYILQGMPTWSLEIRNDYDKRKLQKCKTISECLSRVTSRVVSWNPTDLCLRQKRVSLLAALRYFWKYDARTLPLGIDSLLSNLCATDECRANAQVSNESLSMDVISLRKKSGAAIVTVSKYIPNLLVSWLDQLSERARQLLSTDSLLDPSRMHLFEFLSCVASAVDNAANRASFIGNVMASSLETLRRNDVTEALSSVQNIMHFLGISQSASEQESVINKDHVSAVTRRFAEVYSALNQLLAVGRRCHEASIRRPSGGIPFQNLTNSSKENWQNSRFPDEGPVSLNDLSQDNPFVSLWPQFFPSLLQALAVTLELWHPEIQLQLLQHPLQRYVYAISDDEVFIFTKQDNLSTGGVFGKGGTAGNVVKGCDRRSINLVPRWSGWLNELRNVSFQLLGLAATQRVLYSADMSHLYPHLVGIVCNQKNLMSMEGRHMAQFLKQFIEPLILSCPPSLYGSHLAPILGPILDHMQARLHYTWAPILGISDVDKSSSVALTSQTCSLVSSFASQAGEEWFKSYYARGGLFVGDCDSIVAESAVEKCRVDLTRIFVDMIQCAFALRGDWALVLANISKEEQSNRKKDPRKAASRPKSQFGLENSTQRFNANGTPRTANQDALEARKVARINALASFVLVESSSIALPLVSTIIKCICYPDAYSSRRCIRMCHRVLEVAVSYPQYTEIIGNEMFSTVLKMIVYEPKWMVGMEWDMISLVRDIYCRLVLGQCLLPGGQGASMQQPRAPYDAKTFEQSKNAAKPLTGGGILCISSDIPTNVLLSLPLGSNGQLLVAQLHASLKEHLSAKAQKDLLRNMLRMVASNVKAQEGDQGNSGDTLFGRVDEEESVLNQKLRVSLVPSIPEKLVITSKTLREKQDRLTQSENELLGAKNLQALFG